MQCAIHNKYSERKKKAIKQINNGVLIVCLRGSDNCRSSFLFLITSANMNTSLAINENNPNSNQHSPKLGKRRK
uniref:Uncharacterized protein n=1 Tax=Solanum lycopersicum TaxID=4081 RepID=A0A3Q7FSB7_SOLLC